MLARPVALSVRFRARGWQWPFRPGDSLAVYWPDGTLVAELPATLILELVRVHLAGVAVQTQMAAHLRPLPPPPPDPPPTPRLRAQHGRKLRGL